MIIRSPLDVAALHVTIRDADVVQFDEPLSDSEYRSLAGILEKHPSVTLRVYGRNPVLTKLAFLEHFPRLRRFSVSYLNNLEDLNPINALSADLEFLDIGETLRPLDLSALGFQQLKRLRVAGHSRGLSPLLSRNPEIRSLSLSRIRHDRELSVVTLPGLEQLDLVMGSVEGLAWIDRFPAIRHLGLARLREVQDGDLEAIKVLPRLEWLRLAQLPRVTRLPEFGRDSTLMRVDLDGMSGMRDADALASLTAVRGLKEIEVTSSRLPSAAFAPFVGHPTLSGATIGLGSVKKNDAVQAMLGVPPAASAIEFSECHLGMP